MQKNTSTFTLCNIPLSLKKWLKDKASGNNRSMSGEAINLFEKIKKSEQMKE
jgi:hypothetical protein